MTRKARPIRVLQPDFGRMTPSRPMSDQAKIGDEQVRAELAARHQDFGLEDEDPEDIPIEQELQ